MLIDLHVHIIPGVDDGAQVIEDSLAMAEVAVNDGINIMIATPHVFRGVFDNDKQDILNKVEQFNQYLDNMDIKLVVMPGAEYRLEPDLPQRMADGQLMTLNNTGSYLLVELPSTLIPENTDRILYELQLQGVTPIIAHPERSIPLARHSELLKSYTEKGILAQVTSTSITGLFGKTVRNTALYFLQSGLAQIIASDGHASKGRMPVLSEASKTIERKWGTEYAQTLAFENPRRIIMSQSVTASAPPPQRSFWGFLKRT